MLTWCTNTDCFLWTTCESQTLRKTGRILKPTISVSTTHSSIHHFRQDKAGLISSWHVPLGGASRTNLGVAGEIKSLGWEQLSVPPDELQKMTGVKEVCCPRDLNPDKCQKMDGWVKVSQHKSESPDLVQEHYAKHTSSASTLTATAILGITGTEVRGGPPLREQSALGMETEKADHQQGQRRR